MKSSQKSYRIADWLEDKLSVIGPHEGETLSTENITCRFKITSELSDHQMGLYEITLQPHTIGARPHYHRLTSETFMVTKGILTIQRKSETLEASAGTVIFRHLRCMVLAMNQMTKRKCC